MKVQLLAFGITRDILGSSVLELELAEQSTVLHLKEYLRREFPQFETLKSLAIAVNNEYALDDQRIGSEDEIALIPPVSGG